MLDRKNKMALIFLFSIVVSIFLLRYHWRRRHLYRIASQLSGPPALPLIGNGLTFMCTSEDILKVITNISGKFPKPVRFWFGPDLILYFTAPKHIEKILSSAKLAHKHDVYDDLLKIYLGDGLVTNSGEKYKKHRRLIQPMINLKFVRGNMDVFHKHVNVMLTRLEKHVQGVTFDVHSFIHECFADIIGEIVLGTNMGVQFGKNQDYVKASTDMYTVGFDRLMRPWLHFDLIYGLTQGKKDQDRIISVTTSFIKDQIEKARARITGEQEDDPTRPLIDQIGKTKEDGGDTMSDVDFLYHMYTLYVASEDTMTVIIAILCVCFGMYTDYQKIAAEEIRSVFGEEPKEVLYDDILKLNYLDMCVRDVLRLIPIAPIILRKTIDNFEIDNLTVPKDCGVMVSIFDVHRDPDHWENPDHFHPDHFLPEAVTRRHPYAYVPFSAGPRSCVGKVLAFIGLKIVMANVLQRFEIEADGKFPDIVLRSDITVRSNSGYRIRLKKRIWS